MGLWTMILTRKMTTMTNKLAPWDEIPTPAVDFTVVRVANATGVPIYWGRDLAGQCLFIIALEGDLTEQFRSGIVSLHGINIDLRNGDGAKQQRLILTLARHNDRDLFLGLCETLIDSLTTVTDSGTALAIALAHLKRWKAFLAGRNSRLLSPEEVRGLFGELCTLRTLYQKTLSQEDAIAAWCGPDNSQQDFIFSNRAVEVKSLSGRERSLIKISSEDQLESLADELLLLIQRVIEMPDAEQALSLNEIIELIENELTESQAIEQFYSKLTSISYAPLAEYDSPRFVVSGIRGYRVTTDFPRLMRSKLPQGITNVNYSIELEVIEPFLCPLETIFERS